MKRFLIGPTLCLVLAGNGQAQSTVADRRATKEDVKKYLEVVHSHETVKQMVEAMSRPMRQTVHDECARNKAKLPADFEARTDVMMDDLLRKMPFDEMTEAMVPVYQKYFTKGDLDALVVFYSSSTGRKVLREMPEIAGESVETAVPIAREYMDQVQQRVQEQVTEGLKEAQKKPGQAGRQH